MNPLVSIITPSHQTARWIGAAVRSVRAQTLSSWELLIVEDGSRDGSEQVIRDAAGDDLGRRIHLDATAGGLGAAEARNRALRRAQGRYIAFLDSDDLWYPAKLERQTAMMQRTGAALAHHAFEIAREDGSFCGLARHPPESVGYRQLLSFNIINCSTAMYDRDRCGLMMMPAIAKRQDHGLWLSIMRAGHPAVGLDEILGVYRWRSGSVSSNKLSAAMYQWRLFRDVERLGRLSSSIAFARYAARHLLGRRRERPVTAAETALRPWPIAL